MPPFTITNLKDIEDSAGERAPGIEARFARKHIDSEHLGVSYFRYAAGIRAPMAHSHREQEEAYIVVNGSGRIRLDDEVHEIRQWDVVRISPANHPSRRSRRRRPRIHRRRLGPTRRRRRRSGGFDLDRLSPLRLLSQAFRHGAGTGDRSVTAAQVTNGTAPINSKG